MPNQKSNWIYVYAFILERESPDISFPGLGGAPVRRVALGKVAAIVSDFTEGKVRPERRHLAAHHGVVNGIMKQTTPLPVAFGMIVKTIEPVMKMMKMAGPQLVEELDRLSGTAETTLRLSLDVPNIYDYFIRMHPELKELRDQTFGEGGTHDARIELGRRFDELRTADREAMTDRASEALAPYCIELRRNTPRNDREIANLCCLIPREGMDRFEVGVQTTATLFDDNLALDFSGPSAPYSFVDVQLDPEKRGDK